MNAHSSVPLGLQWRLRRVAAGLRLQDVAPDMGLSITRLCQIERGERAATELEKEMAEHVLPPLPEGLTRPVSARGTSRADAQQDAVL